LSKAANCSVVPDDQIANWPWRVGSRQIEMCVEIVTAQQTELLLAWCIINWLSGEGVSKLHWLGHLVLEPY